MALVIQTNVASLQAQTNLSMVSKVQQASFSKLSSGYRINTAADDAAGLAISESFKAQIRSFSVAERNANDGVSMAQTAEGALGQVSNLLTRMRELSVQASNGAINQEDRGYLNTEFKQLKSEVSRIQVSTSYNGKSLIKSTAAATKFQVGVNAATSDSITVTFGGVSLSTLLSTANNVAGAGATAALAAISKIDNALKTVSTQRAKYGATMNRLDVTTANIQTVRTNLAAANSRIRDVDVAEESSQLSRSQVLGQAAAAVLAQANQAPQLALGLLR